MTLEVLLTKSSFVLGSLWKLRINIDGFKSENSDELVTQASIGRSFQLIDCLKSNFKNREIIDRVKVRFLEDDYICWLKFSELKFFLFSSINLSIISSLSCSNSVTFLFSRSI